MQVFKLYFKVLRSHMGIMLMYLGIFMGVFLGFIIPNMVSRGEAEYTKAKCDFAVFDYDESSLSHALVEYMSEMHNISSIGGDDVETIQDELYAQNVDSVICIRNGFEEAFAQGNGAEYLELYAIPDTVASVLFKQNLGSYLSAADIYVRAGFDMSAASVKAAEALTAEVQVELTDENEAQEKSAQHYYFNYLIWIFISMSVTGITPVLLAMDKKAVRDRVNCSSYKFTKMNVEIVLGVAVTGMIICGIFVAAAFVIGTEEMLGVKGLLYSVNAVCTMLVALAITFLISKLADNPNAISLLANVIGLGMAFLCGIFVPMEFLSDTIITIAHFLPAFWGVKAVSVIDSFSTRDIGRLAAYLGMQLLFAAAIICIGMMVARKKRITE